MKNNEVIEMAKRPSSDAHRRAVRKYNQENAKAISLTLFKHSEADCLEKLASVDSMRAYLIALIRQDIARERALEQERANAGKD